MSRSKLPFYIELLDYFFDTDLRFRAVGVDKSLVRSESHDTAYDDFYYRMYYFLLNYKVNTLYHYNVYLDIKDTWSNVKVARLSDILNVRYGVFRNVQCITSGESLLLQLADFIMGAIAYNANVEVKTNQAKVRLVEQIQKHCPDLLHACDTEKFNLSYIHLK